MTEIARKRAPRVAAGSAGTVALVMGIIGLLGQVLSMGYGAPWFMLCSVAAWALGQREVQKYRALGVPTSDLGLARTGHVLGIIGVGFSLLIALVLTGLIVLVVALAGQDAIHVKLLTEF